ncbi:MAG: hypothetical protein ACOYOH_18865 [Paracraurococcus sp.]|jgi:hypothetical protein
MSETLTIDESDFQAALPMLLDRLSAGGLDRIEMTRAGAVVAVVSAPPATAPAATMPDIYGFLRGSVVMPPGIDLTSPVLDAFLAEEQDDFEA